MNGTFSIYVDESGNTGKQLFHNPPIFYQGALLCSANCDELFEELVKSACSEYRIDRLHAHRLGIDGVQRLVPIVANLLSGYEWSFNVFSIEKPYVATCKFVDTFCDAGINIEVPYVWYNHQYYKHILCLNCDYALGGQGRELFWEGFLKNDKVKLVHSLEIVESGLSRNSGQDLGCNDFMFQALSYAKMNIDNFIEAKVKRYGYQSHTPSMIAFSRLFDDAEEFSKKYSRHPKLLLYDRQGEFGRTMKKWFQEYSAYTLKMHSGFFGNFENVSKQIKKFEISGRLQGPGLQIVDSLLWLYQRGKKVNEALMPTLKDRIVEYEISKLNSLVVKKVWEVGYARGKCQIPHPF